MAADDVDAVLIGDGPELPAVRQAAERIDGVTCVGPVAHDAMPACLATADVGVAPFDVGRHAPLSLGFFWSPLKLFEYMASGLPVVAPAIHRITQLVGDGEEGILYDADDPASLAGAHRAAVRSRVAAATRRRRRAPGRYATTAGTGTANGLPRRSRPLVNAVRAA